LIGVDDIGGKLKERIYPMILGDIAHGKTGFADIMFLVAFILFVILFIIYLFVPVDAKIANALLAAGLACVALGWLVL
jgi:hypothetical protein